MSGKAVTTVAYRDELLKSLKNPEEAALYLNACLEDGDPRVFLMALRDVADAHGGIRTLSHDTRLNRESLYRMLSRAGNPSLDSLAAVLNALGLRFVIERRPAKRRARHVA
jgi:probable addiction module antidote protein